MPRIRWRGIVDIPKGFAGSKGPVLQKSLLQLTDHRPFHAKMDVDHASGILALRQVTFADIHAAGITGFAIHHQQLAMVA